MTNNPASCYQNDTKGDCPLLYPTWHNETLGVALMTLGTVTLLKQIRSDGTGLIYRKLIVPISKASYGMYLMHLMPLPIISDSLRQTSLPTPVIILTTAAITFLITAIVSIIIQRIPKIGKYIVG